MTKKVTRKLTLSISAIYIDDKTYMGYAELLDAEGNRLDAEQNLWGSAYKAAGQKLFSTKSGKKTLAYRTFSRTADVNGKICPLTIKVTTGGVLTATLTYDTGKKSKGKPVYYKPTCTTVVWPTSSPDDDALEADAILYFAPSAANNLPLGFSTYETFAR